MNKQKTLAIALIVILAAVLVWVLFFWSPNNGKSSNHEVFDLSATPTGGNFTVQTINGDLSLSTMKGKVVILYFGYTQCPDICPTSLALLSQALNEMSPEELTEVESLFVSVDPGRDTPERLNEYTHYFHPEITGGTADKVEIDRTAALYGASYRIVDSGSAMGYIVDHSSFTYVIDKEGKLRHSLVHGTEPAEILKVVRELLAE